MCWDATSHAWSPGVRVERTHFRWHGVSPMIRIIKDTTKAVFGRLGIAVVRDRALQDLRRELERLIQNQIAGRRFGVPPDASSEPCGSTPRAHKTIKIENAAG